MTSKSIYMSSYLIVDLVVNLMWHFMTRDCQSENTPLFRSLLLFNFKKNIPNVCALVCIPRLKNLKEIKEIKPSDYIG